MVQRRPAAATLGACRFGSGGRPGGGQAEARQMPEAAAGGADGALAAQGGRISICESHGMGQGVAGRSQDYRARLGSPSERMDL